VRTTRIKFCGITGVDDAQLAVDAGAWAVGMVFWKGSPRRCSLPDAERIASRLRRTVEVVGVFVNA
jgi:phosphoribosylanthranilate isomerase